MLRHVHNEGERTFDLLEIDGKEGEWRVLGRFEDEEALYQISDRRGDRTVYRVRRIEDGQTLRAYDVRPGTGSCECKGRHFRWRCRHLCILDSMKERGYLCPQP